MSPFTTKDFARFWANVAVSADPAACWNWIGDVFADRGGYGRFHVGGEALRANRVAYTMAGGLIPPGDVVRHVCDNPRCCNPAHLVVGTFADNARDRSERGRGADRRGVKHPLAALSEPEVIEIRRLAAMGRTHASIAADYEVSRQQVGKIVRRENWSHV